MSLHAHSFVTAVQPDATASTAKDFEAQMRRQFLGRAYQCASCAFGPIDHFACGDLAAHHGQNIGNASINNACPRCGWFSRHLADWPKWNGFVPLEARQSENKAESPKCASAASLAMALRICYSARSLWQLGPEGVDLEAQGMVDRMANWETITADDGVRDPALVLLAMAALDDVPAGAWGPVPLRILLNEVCARQALRETSDAAFVRKRVAAFLGVRRSSAPGVCPLEEPEPHREAIREQCRTDYDLNPNAFDFKSWVRIVLAPWEYAISFTQRLRRILTGRLGGWPQLAADMESGPEAYMDIIHALQRPVGSNESLRALLGVEHPCDAERVLAAVVAQAFLHSTPASRRVVENGGTLAEPLGDVHDSATLRSICLDLRMAVYDERAAAKAVEWRRLIQSVEYKVRMAARVADVDEFCNMCGDHVHGLSKTVFWALWRGASDDPTGRLGKAFLRKANHGFANKYR
jgi:hypothetical protein